MNFLSPVLGLLGLDQQYNANQAAKNQAQQQLALQQQMEQAQMAAYNNYMSNIGKLQQQGAFNPAARLQELGQQGQYDLSNALSSEAGAARALGYRPGDTVPVGEMNQTMGNYNLEQEQSANQILNQSNANYLAALQGAPSVSDLGSGIGATGENARMFYGQQAGSGGMLGALAQYLGQGSSALGSGGTGSGYSSLGAAFPNSAQEISDIGQNLYDSSGVGPSNPSLGDLNFGLSGLAPKTGVASGALTAPIVGANGQTVAPTSIATSPGQGPSAAIQSVGVIPAAPNLPGGAPAQAATLGGPNPTQVPAGTPAGSGYGGIGQRTRYRMPTPTFNL